MVKIRASSRSNRSWGSSNWWHNHQPGTRPCFVNEEVTLIQVLQVRVPLRNGRENHGRCSSSLPTWPFGTCRKQLHTEAVSEQIMFVFSVVYDKWAQLFINNLYLAFKGTSVHARSTQTMHLCHIWKINIHHEIMVVIGCGVRILIIAWMGTARLSRVGTTSINKLSNPRMWFIIYV